MQTYEAVMAELLQKVRTNRPLVHQITNYVTVNDCANVTLGIGGSPVMADDADEVKEMVSIASALVINIGTLNSRTIDSMLIAGRQANERGIPVILDPVGAGATKLRTETAQCLISELKLAVIKGNVSEMKVLGGLDGHTRGVDSVDELEDGEKLAATLAKRHNCVVAITGPQDIVSDGQRTVLIDNGHPLMAAITGTGCMTGALVGAFCGVTDDYLAGTVAAIVGIGIAGEKAAAIAGEQGIGSFRFKLVDAISSLSPQDLQQGAKLHAK